MRQELRLPSLTEEQALERIIKWLNGFGKNALDPVNYPSYGHELYIPNVIFQCLQEVMAEDRSRNPSGMRSYAMDPDQPGSKVFYDAAWALVQKGVLRPNPPNRNANGLDINKGFTVTSYGKKWLERVKEDDAVLADLLRPQDDLVSADTEIANAPRQSSLPTQQMNDDKVADNSGVNVTPATPNIDNGPLLSNRYRILSQFPSSGFGQAFLAEDTFLPSRRKCVIKQFTFTSNSPETYQLILKRFEREAAILEKLAESNEQIPDLYAHFSDNGQFYLVQEWIEGDTVAAKVAASGPFGEEKVKEIIRSLLHVLAYIHSRSIIHRDIKPENIILRQGDDKPFLIDFGSVKEISRTVLDPFGNPSTTIVIGTPGYMPLEQTAGRAVFASDLYALGLTAIYMLTGKRPQDLTDMRTGDIAWHKDATYVSARFAAILDKAILPNFRERYPGAQEMLDDLNMEGQDTLVEAPDDTSRPNLAEERKPSNINRSVSAVSLEDTDSNMPQVATWWLRDFLNPVVDLVGEIKKKFDQNAFSVARTSVGPHSTAYTYRIDFFRRETWDELLASDVGEYFLIRFPHIKEMLASFEENVDSFEYALGKLEQSIEESPHLLKQLKDVYERLISRERIPRSQYENFNLKEIAQHLLGQLHLEISKHPLEGKENLVRFIAYSLLGLNVTFKENSITEDQQLFYFCRDISNELISKDDAVSKALEESKRLFAKVKDESSTLHQQLKNERIEIARRYNATFER